jgi:hypothetical protein
MLPIELLLDSMGRSLRENPHNAAALNMRTPLPGVPPINPQPALAALSGKLWRPGRTLRISFLDGDPAVQERIPEFAAVWTRHANLHFDFTQDPAAEIRISFSKPGSWSYIGVDALSVPQNQPTMNFGWLTPLTDDEEFSRVVIHEFGHALGCIHEHQSPAAGIPWNKPAVYEYYAGPPNYWTKKQVDANIFKRYSTETTQFSRFDPESIMLYPIPNAFTLGDFEVGWNRTLSTTDEQYVAALYPAEEKDAVPISVDAEPIPASIGRYGEVDSFFFVVTRTGTYQIETEGRTDVVASLFGPDNDTHPIAQDDNSGRHKNARIITALTPGTYTVRVRHFSASGLGGYAISVCRVA